MDLDNRSCINHLVHMLSYLSQLVTLNRCYNLLSLCRRIAVECFSLNDKKRTVIDIDRFLSTFQRASKNIPSEFKLMMAINLYGVNLVDPITIDLAGLYNCKGRYNKGAANWHSQPFPHSPLIRLYGWQGSREELAEKIFNSLTHIWFSKLTIIGWDDGVSLDWRQTIIWTDAGILLT